ncbi:hypothetical protein AFK24_07940 [Pseudomonas syringae]|uniref:Uncharacterized protein n=1 Tax=Pseudomonas syringae TaxID=317 RepID=A0A1C7Z9M2_PSESX|nr:hypothetical protein [Pseudomonas syringae]OCR25647.1 hypothetical protein AFK24_07940 [Pseudomonas syringae]
MVEIEVVFSERLRDCASVVWGSLIQPLKKINESAVIDGFTGKRILLADVSDYLIKNKCRSFFIELANGSVEFSYVADKAFYRLDIKHLANSIEVAQSLIEALIDESGFVQARIYDAEYDRWQNAESLTLFEVECVEHAHLPKKSNGLPFPLTQEIVDISKNPGRWVLRNGYIEAVGAFMWVSKSLLQVVGVDEKTLMDVDCFAVEDLGGGLKIAAYDQCFTSAVGEQAERQVLLRKFLFNA